MKNPFYETPKLPPGQRAENSSRRKKTETMNPDSNNVRKFVSIYIGQARSATCDVAKPRIVNMVTFHPSSEDVASVYRFALDDEMVIERMTETALAASSAGFNVYVEPRLVRPDLKGKRRGTIKDTRAVFAFVVDGDADKGVAWARPVPTSLTVETSPPANKHDWLFLDKAIEVEISQELGERLRASAGADTDTGVVTQCYRVAGTTNYPNARKIVRGRTESATKY
jgi:hypothetical protein